MKKYIVTTLICISFCAINSFSQIIPIRIISTNGTIASFDPTPPTPSFTVGTVGPYIDGVNKAGKIVNVCSGETVTLTSTTSTTLLNSYQWFVCVASKPTVYIKGISSYEWSTWRAVSGATSKTLNVSYSSFGTTKLHMIYVCAISSKLGTSYTSAVALSKASAPTIYPLVVEQSYACPGATATVVPDFEVLGDNVNVYWQKQIQNQADTSWVYYSSTVSPFSFPAADYINNVSDYRLAIDHSCVNYRSTALHDMPVIITAANNESFATISAANRIKTTCINSLVDLTVSINGYNAFHTYTHSWEYLPEGATTWVPITSSANDVFSDYTTLSLKVRPNSTTHNNMQFRCKSVGACQTIVSEPFTLNLNIPPVISNIVASQNTACVGEVVTLNAQIVSNSLSTPVQYRWRVNGNIGVGQTFSSTNSSYSYTMPNAGVTFTCEVQNGASCINQVSDFSKTVQVYSAPTVTINATSTGCGGSTADLTAEVTGGKSPYSYNWTIPPASTATSVVITNQPANETYTVAITDACGKTDNETLFVSSLPVLSVQKATKNVMCNSQSNGELHAIIAGGVIPYNFELFKVVESVDSSVQLISNATSGLIDITNLNAGNYKLVAIDVCNTTITQTFEITQPDILQTAITALNNVTCNKGGDGSATVSVWGGTVPYTLNWINGQHTATANGLFAGDYLVNVTDNNGCLSGTQAKINEPEKLVVTISKQDVTCNGLQNGIIDIDIQNGTAPYVSYMYSANDTVWGTNFIDLQVGNYTVNVIDACGAIYSQNISISEPLPLDISLYFSNISCFGRNDGSATVHVNSGIEPYTFDWSTGDTVEAIVNVIPGTYSVTVTDACGTISENVEIIEPEELQVQIDKTDISCNGGIDSRAVAYVEGGTEPFYYSWSNGSLNPYIENIAQGRYTVSVSDKNGCVSQQSVTIVEPESLTVTSLITHVTCNNANDGVIYIQPLTGVAPFTFEWDNDFEGDTIENVEAENYSVTITDACGDEIIQNIVVTQPEPLQVQKQITNVRCNGQTNGEVFISVTEGVQPYSILWNNSATGYVLENLAADTLIYTITDECQTITDTAIITEPEVFDISVQSTEISCYGIGDATAQVIPVGGVSPYTYRWNTGMTMQSVQGLFPGLYSVNVFDANSCLATEIFTIENQLPLHVSTVVQNTECMLSNGKIVTTATGGVAPYSFLCEQNQVTTDTIKDLGVGIYDIEVTDAHGCITTTQAELGMFTSEYPICILSVTDEGKNRVVWEKYGDVSMLSVNIYKMVGGDYEWMGTVDSSRFSYFDDPITNPNVVPSRYAITTNDACGNESDFSPFHQTIHLGAAKGVDENSVVLDWTEYLDESHEFIPQWYYLYKGTDENNMELFDSVDARVASECNDDNPQGAKFYKVGVRKDDPCVVTGLLKAESGPFSLAMSNIAETENTGVLQIENTEIILYPNPNNGICIIQNDVLQGAMLEIQNISGQVIWKSEAKGNVIEIDIQNQKSGIYTVTIAKDGKEYVAKFVKL